MENLPVVLVVDDVPNNIKALAEILKEDYDVKVASSGERALEITKQTPIDLILLDVEMPEMDGYKVCEILKNNTETKNIPIIFVTIHGEEENEVRGLELGAVDYIIKPIQPSIVKRRVATHIKLREYQKELLNYQSFLELKVQEEMEKREAQELILVQQSKMAAMGEMIGSIAHQMMQPLNSINLATALIETESEEKNSNIQEGCDTIYDMVTYLTDTIGDFKNFYKPNKLKEEFSVLSKIENSEKILKHQLHNNDIALKIRGEDFKVYGKKNELMQVFINLFSNAKDALIERKRDERFIIVTLESDEENGQITIRDNGGGIPDEVIGKIFDSYASTKGSKGTGIGLYMSKTIIEGSFNGTIKGENREDGAVFTITIPLQKR